ncbi:MAG: bifunctional methylenetetrahydrofolate dehydrogenase/methenyltetrahydrofolate cyclohydrolase [Candidatus Lokiarchaeota archaeon]|nr:bifunctional methylenetetrahydrofolate dehydrogenase/methenyltetrahydrofolate cyclohydrolase [Candidatus Lokiarchaeota archaeon]
MTLILDGKKLAATINEEIKNKVDQAAKKYNRQPGLATILVGEDPASELYVGMKVKACNRLGIHSEQIRLSENVTKEKLINKIHEINDNPKIDGILLQLPLPKDLKQHTNKILQEIAPDKDVDGFLPRSIGLVVMGDETYGACTPKGMIRLLERNDVEIEGKEVVIVNRTTVIGKPLAVMFTNRHGTVTVCHSRTKDLDFHLKRADIIAVGVGKVKFLTADRIKEGVVVLDAGINHDENGKLCGDADFEGIKDKCAAITPVPGGVGPMTIAMLMENTYLSFMNRITTE